MSFLPFALDDGTPNPSAMFVNALLAQGLYLETPEAFNAYAQISGSTLVRFDAHKETFRPDTGVLIQGNNALVILDGTTNSPQWAAHVGSAVFPTADVVTGTFVAGSFYAGEALVDAALKAAVVPAIGGTVRVSGHSYGAAAAHIFVTHLGYDPDWRGRIELMTFGEPASYSGQTLTHVPDVHFRIVAGVEELFDESSPSGVDPVALAPPPAIVFVKFGVKVGIVALLTRLRWRDRGVPFELTNARLQRVHWFENLLTQLPFVHDSELVLNIPFIIQHLMASSYLAKAFLAWERSGLNPELAPLIPIAARYIAGQVTPPANLIPPVPAETINDGWQLPAGTVTEENRLDWATVSSSTFVPFTGATSMTLMRGSFLNNTMGQGFSESWHSSSPSDTYQTMRTKMATIQPFRAGCTNTIAQTTPYGNPANLLNLQYVRVSDDLVNRDVFAFATATPIGWNGASGNLDGNLAAKLVWRDSTQRQIAVSYLHGVPAGASAVQPGDAANLDVGTRQNQWKPTFLQALTLYCNAVAGQGLGFNTLNVNPANAFGPISAVTYNTVSGYYNFTVTNGVPQGKFRVRLASFKSLNFLNGRQSAQSTGANTFVVFKKAQAGTWDQSGTAVPLSGYNNGTPFSNYIVAVPASVQPTLLCTKKVGKPFFLQAGRISRRAA